MKKSTQLLVLSGLVSTSLQATVENSVKPNVIFNSMPEKGNYFVEQNGYRRLMTDDKAINDLDLEPIKVKLMDSEDGYGWTLEEADVNGEKYRAFLYLIKKYKDKKIVPTKEIDAFWHAHILDTYKYHDDCQEIFGEYLHHFPYFGMRNEDDEKDLKSSFSETLDLYRKEFPSPLSPKVIQKEALCIGEKGTRCTAIEEEVARAALCIGEKGTRCSAIEEEVSKAALCIGETKCKVAESGVRDSSRKSSESQKAFRNRIRPRIDRATGTAYYQD